MSNGPQSRSMCAASLTEDLAYVHENWASAASAVAQNMKHLLGAEDGSIVRFGDGLK